MRFRIPVILFLFLLLGAPQARAQYYTTGSAPTSVRWSQIKSDHFTVIFPREIDSLAREYLYGPLCLRSGVRCDRVLYRCSLVKIHPGSHQYILLLLWQMG